jgi:outer membrane protein assembly factor BamB
MERPGCGKTRKAGRLAATGCARLVLLVAAFVVALGCTPTPKPYAPPGKTTWSPEGCRSVPSDNSVLGLPAEFFRGLHADTANSDEVAIALAPVLEFEWVAEPLFYIAEGPTFDRRGNLYFSPILPAESVILVSLEPETGARRWAVTGTNLYGGGAPLVLDDPANPGEQIVYLGLYDRALAIRPDGTIVWDVPTGLPAPPPPSEGLTAYHCFGLNYHVQADALVGITGDGNLYVLDRGTGAPLLGTPFVVPGSPSPPRPGGTLPADIAAKANAALLPLLGALPPQANAYGAIADVLLGFNSQVANYFAVDPHSGRIWVAATAPDGEDGTVDGVSELGALYCLELVTAGGPPYTVHELFHTSFVGGSASSPALNADGTRVYVGDNMGHLIAVDSNDGSKIWELDVGAQIYGSVGVASDNGELYASTAQAVVKVIDTGAAGDEVWRTTADGYTPGIGQSNYNLNLAGIGANGIFVHAGAGPIMGTTPLPLSLGVGLLDRETGKTLYFADGREETVSAMSTGPDGALYLGHSPLRRAAAWAVFGGLGWTRPITGGVGKYAARRNDLVIRDAACAGSARAANAFAYAGDCPDSAAADIRQVRALIDQARRASVKAVADGDISPDDWALLDGYFALAETVLSPGTLDVAADYLGQACEFFPD